MIERSVKGRACVLNFQEKNVLIDQAVIQNMELWKKKFEFEEMIVNNN